MNIKYILHQTEYKNFQAFKLLEPRTTEFARKTPDFELDPTQLHCVK